MIYSCKQQKHKKERKKEKKKKKQRRASGIIALPSGRQLGAAPLGLAIGNLQGLHLRLHARRLFGLGALPHVLFVLGLVGHQRLVLLQPTRKRRSEVKKKKGEVKKKQKKGEVKKKKKKGEVKKKKKERKKKEGKKKEERRQTWVKLFRGNCKF